MRVLHAPLSALALAAAIAAGGASEALAQQPTTRPRADTARTGMPNDTARAGMPSDTARGGRTTSTATGEVTNLAGPSAAPIVASLRTDAHAMALLHESNVGEIAAAQRALREAGDSSVRAFAQMMITDHTALDAQGMALGQKLGVTPALPDSALPQLQQTELQALPGDSAGASSTSSTTSPMASPMTPNPTTSPTSPATSPTTRPDSTAMPMPATTGTDSTMRNPTGMHAMGAMGGGANAFDRAYVAQQVTAHARTLALVDAAIARGTQAELKSTLQSEVRPKIAAHLQQAQELQRKVGGQ